MTTHCSRCRRTWGMSTRQAHCTRCCAHFTTPRAFDLRLTPAGCRPPGEVMRKGAGLLARRDSGIWSQAPRELTPFDLRGESSALGSPSATDGPAGPRAERR